MIGFYFDKVAQLPRAGNASLLLGFAQGGRFAVSRTRIRMRPKSYYQALLAHVDHEVHPRAGAYLEAMWYDVFHPESLQVSAPVCAYPAVPERGRAMTIEQSLAAAYSRIPVR